MTSESDAPGWLSPAEMAAWRPLIEFVLGLPQALDRRLRADAGVSHAYFVLLTLLSESPQRALSMGDLAKLGQMSPSRLTHAVGVFEERGWVQRTPGGESGLDARVIMAALTPEGFAALEQHAHAHVTQVRELVFDRLSSEQVDQLADIMAVLNQA